MRHLDLFSGIGGFALAASKVWPDHGIHSFVEIDSYCQEILRKHWPNAPIHSDIRTYQHDKTTIDLLTGGFPCQPFSCAGSRKGSDDNRYLWPEMLRVIEQTRPRWIIGENVSGLLSIESGLVFEGVCLDLEDKGYEVWPLSIPAGGVDAPHKRERIWIVAHTSGTGCEELNVAPVTTEQRHVTGSDDTESLADTANTGVKSVCGRKDAIFENVPTKTGWLTEPAIRRVANGIPNRVDRLRSLGNAIVPQCVMPIMQSIKDLEGILCKS